MVLRPRRLLPAACMALGLTGRTALAGPIDLSANEQQLGPLGAAPAGAGPSAPVACGGITDACSGAATTFKAPLGFTYGVTAAAGVAGSNHGFGSELGVGAWIKPDGTDATLSVSIIHEQWNGKYRHY